MRSEIRRERSSWTTSRSTFFDRERRSCLVQRRRDDCPMCRPLVLCRKQSARRERSSRSRSSLHSWWSAARGRRRCRAQRRRSRQHSLTPQRVTRSGTRQVIASRTTSRSTFFDRARRSCLVQRRRDDCPMCRPLVLCRRQSARRERSSRSRSSLHSWWSSARGRRRCRAQRRRSHR